MNELSDGADSPSLSPGEKAGVRASVNFLIALLVVVWCFDPGASLHAQSFAIDWFKIAGGGGTSTGAAYSVSGTLGQPDAGVMSGGLYSLVGGFWGVVSAIQTPGAPLLSVIRTNGVVTVYWPLPASGFVLEQSGGLSNAPPQTVWSPVGLPYDTNASHIFITAPAPAGNKFYRLRNP